MRSELQGSQICDKIDWMSALASPCCWFKLVCDAKTKCSRDRGAIRDANTLILHNRKKETKFKTEIVLIFGI